MLKRLLRAPANFAMWVCYGIGISFTYMAHRLDTYVQGEEKLDLKQADEFYIRDLQHFEDREDVGMSGQTALIVLDFTEQALNASRKERVDLAIGIRQVTSAIPQVRTSDEGSDFIFVDGGDVDNNIAISMWMAYFYAYHTGYLNRV